MRIAIICQSYPPMVSGAALVIQRLAQGIADRGHKIAVLTASDLGSAYSQQENGLDIVRIQSYKNPLRVGQNFVIWAHDFMLKALNEFQPEVVHLHDTLNFGVSAIRAARKMKIPSVLTIHQLPWFISMYLPTPPRIQKLVENSAWRYSNWLLKQFDASIAPSKAIAEIVEKKTKFRPEVISNGVDLVTFSPESIRDDEFISICDRYQLDPKLPILLYVGRVDEDKRVDLVVQAAANVMKALDIQLVVVGDGKQRDEIIKLSHTLGIYERCSFPGYVSKSGDLPGLYRSSTVFVTASEVEIQSSVVLEAAASGVPVVTVNASSMCELVQHGESGFLVEPRDVDAVAERIALLVTNPEKAESMGLAGRVLAEFHSNERFLNAHEELYASIAVQDVQTV